MSQLPPGWVLVTPDAITACERNALAIGPFGSNLKVSDYRSDGVPLVFVRNIRARAFGPADLRFVSREKAETLRAHQVSQGDLLITKMGDPPGDVAVYPLTQPGIVTADCIKLTPHPSIDVRYLLHAFGTPEVQRQIGGITQGVAQRKVSLDRFRKGITIPLMPYAEQKRIVEAIEEQFSRIDAGAAALDRVRRNLNRMRAAVLQAAVTGTLTHRREREGGIEQPQSGWRTLTVGDIAEVSGGITKNPKRRPDKSPVPFLRVANVHRDRLDLSEVHDIEVFDGELDRFQLRRGDLLVVEGNGSPDQIGRSALWNGEIHPCVHQNHLIRVRPCASVVPEYLNLYWNAPSSMGIIQAAASSTSGLHTLSTGKVRSIPVALPPLEMQNMIVEEARRQLSLVDAAERELRVTTLKTDRLRSAVLATAFAGTLVDQDPADEPSSVLLGRIHTERANADGGVRRARVKA